MCRILYLLLVSLARLAVRSGRSGDLVALAPAANRQTLDPTLEDAGPAIHLRLASSPHR
ncbi:hypothetical protein [Candidatus Poriferisodalis sp.]|uniref:hypothetical protein n=1 Tax=Candidatus Poriferisodalis sp. TaxID=3101277 RepID=UPI003B027AD5